MEIKEVFEPIVSFVKNFQKKEKDISKQAAKDRLKLVLMQDRASVSPDFFEMMKKEIIDVIKKYIEIDEESLEVQLTRGYEAGLEGPALYANIPIKNVKPIATNGDGEITENEINEITNAVTEDMLDEANKICDGLAYVKAEISSDTDEEANTEYKNEKSDMSINVEKNDKDDIHETEENISDDDTAKTADIIAENVSKEMKKSAAKAAAAKASAAKRTVKKATTTKTTAKKVTKKDN